MHARTHDRRFWAPFTTQDRGGKKNMESGIRNPGNIKKKARVHPPTHTRVLDEAGWHGIYRRLGRSLELACRAAIEIWLFYLALLVRAFGFSLEEQHIAHSAPTYLPPQVSRQAITHACVCTLRGRGERERGVRMLRVRIESVASALYLTVRGCLVTWLWHRHRHRHWHWHRVSFGLCLSFLNFLCSFLLFAFLLLFSSLLSLSSHDYTFFFSSYTGWGWDDLLNGRKW